MRLSENNEVLTDGIGQCSVPMWCSGLPAGFCDKPAYGKPPECEHWRDAYGEMRRADGRYNGYVPSLACRGHGGPKTPPGVRVYMDGDQWCAVGEGFIDIQESPCGFGDTEDKAISALALEPKL